MGRLKIQDWKMRNQIDQRPTDTTRKWRPNWKNAEMCCASLCYIWILSCCSVLIF